MLMPAAVPPEQAWSEPGVVIRNIYEGQSHVVRADTGKNIRTDLAPVVDVMVAGRILKGIPVRMLERIV